MPGKEARYNLFAERITAGDASSIVISLKLVSMAACSKFSTVVKDDTAHPYAILSMSCLSFPSRPRLLKKSVRIKRPPGFNNR